MRAAKNMLINTIKGGRILRQWICRVRGLADFIFCGRKSFVFYYRIIGRICVCGKTAKLTRRYNGTYLESPETTLHLGSDLKHWEMTHTANVYSKQLGCLDYNLHGKEKK